MINEIAQWVVLVVVILVTIIIVTDRGARGAGYPGPRSTRPPTPEQIPRVIPRMAWPEATDIARKRERGADE